LSPILGTLRLLWAYREFLVPSFRPLYMNGFKGSQGHGSQEATIRNISIVAHLLSMTKRNSSTELSHLYVSASPRFKLSRCTMQLRLLNVIIYQQCLTLVK